MVRQGCQRSPSGDRGDRGDRERARGGNKGFPFLTFCSDSPDTIKGTQNAFSFRINPMGRTCTSYRVRHDTLALQCRI